MTNNHLAAARRTTIIMRDSAEPFGPRFITDDATALTVRAFPFADIAPVTAGGMLATAGTYLLCGPAGVYIGESGNIGRRLQEHALDRSKSFAVEVFVIAGPEYRLDKPACIYLQKQLSDMVEAVDVTRLIKGTNACTVDLPAHRTASLDRMLADSLPLLFDAGCRCFASVPQAPPKVSEQAQCPNGAAPAVAIAENVNDDHADEGDEEGPMLIGVTTVPLGVEELELNYGDLWARGYEHQGRFVVAAGSEMRTTPNPSANEHTLARRRRLISTEAMLPVEGTEDRQRLQMAVAFPSRAIAAKVLSGAHLGSDKWRPLRAAAPFIIAA
ncbi:MAG: hypothetical protein Q7T81_14630 [Pseudolabrys sp.]|nr:hypothetical protein [Pseudolabrys sp.]